MSKAFTKEQDSDGPEDEAPEESLLPQGTKNYITPAGAERLRSELKKLLNEDRPEMVRTVSWAASNGDRSENGDYIYGKRRLREIDRRIRFLTRRLDSAEVIDPVDQGRGPNAHRVVFGATVEVRHESGQLKKYAIVGIDEADPARGRVSWISPIAKVLLGAEAGDAVILRTPRGDEELEVTAVQYVAIPE